MTELLLNAAVGFIVELARSAGHDAGIRIVAALGPHLSAEEAGKAWVALVNACRNAAAQAAASGEPLPPEEWSRMLAITLNPDGSIPVSNPLAPPDPELM